MTPLPELVSIKISPFSLKARFALKHHRITYKTTPYSIPWGEYLLRLRLWKWIGKLTVPVMFTPKDGVLMDSLDIAKWADMHSQRPGAEVLFPAGRDAEICKWNQLSDQVLFYGRRSMVEAVYANKALLRFFKPSFMRMMGPLGDWVALMALRHFGAKYSKENAAGTLEKAREALEAARAALKAGGGQYLVGNAFTYADIVMAVSIQMVSPIGPPYSSSLGSRPINLEDLKRDFADLVAWRDSIFQKHFLLDEGAASSKKAA